jgi:Flavodoxin
MNVVVVYESVFGNTRVIAEAVADGVREADTAADVAVLAVADAVPAKISEAALVVAGGPTHMLGMSKASTRRQALQADAKPVTGSDDRPRTEPGAGGPGIREWLEALPRPVPGRVAAAFDTRLPFPLAGGAARPIARGLRRQGYRLITKPQGFVVEGAPGPLRPGERDRARAWGAALARQLAAELVH